MKLDAKRQLKKENYILKWRLVLSIPKDAIRLVKCISTDILSEVEKVTLSQFADIKVSVGNHNLYRINDNSSQLTIYSNVHNYIYLYL